MLDVVVIGGGIVGLATAQRLLERFPGLSVAVLEKEGAVAAHQTGHNSGVLHSGIYYRPGSLRAQNCRTGKAAMVEFCQREGVPFDLCGKVIVAADDSERPALHSIYERGVTNGVSCELIDGARLREIEPHAAGVAAIHVPEAGIVDYVAVCQALVRGITRAGGQVHLSTRVAGVRTLAGEVVIETTTGEFAARHLITCGGLQSDRVARLTGAVPESRIVPFRGEYFTLRPEAESLCRGLIYPVPDARFPFLGVHFTRMICGGVECGPNAVLAGAREGYHKTDVDLRDLWDAVSFVGFRRLARKYWRTGLGEMWRSMSKAAFVRALQRLVPAIRAEHLELAPSGIRAQAVTPAGDLVDDFQILAEGRVINVCNAPSPAATASLNIGELIVARLAATMELR